MRFEGKADQQTPKPIQGSAAKAAATYKNKPDCGYVLENGDEDLPLPPSPRAEVAQLLRARRGGLRRARALLRTTDGLGGQLRPGPRGPGEGGARRRPGPRPPSAADCRCRQRFPGQAGGGSRAAAEGRREAEKRERGCGEPGCPGREF